jgi:hypothetical protein
MARPRALSVLAGLGTLAAGLALFRRGLGRRHDRVDLYFDDGSMLSLADGPQAERLLEIARAAL